MEWILFPGLIARAKRRTYQLNSGAMLGDFWQIRKFLKVFWLYGHDRGASSDLSAVSVFIAQVAESALIGFHKRLSLHPCLTKEPK